MGDIKILMIEDVQIAQVAAFNLFKKLNYDVHIVTNGVKALEQVLLKHYDIIFVDLQLPDMNGFELAKTIRNIERRTPRVPMIAVTANSEQELKSKSKNAGFDDYLLKPLTIEAIRHIMFKHLNKVKTHPHNHDAA
jgi:CheY-like chemotaxis protein